MRGTLRALTVALALVAVAGCGGSEEPVTDAVEDQLRYIEPTSQVVAAIDLRYEGENWERLREFASRVLRHERARTGILQGTQYPPNLDGALEQLSRRAGLAFEEDVKPVLDGHLVLGVSQPPRNPLPRELSEVHRLMRGAIYDPSRRRYVR